MKRNQDAWIIMVGYLTALVPWIFITRCVFAYHFYPSSCFLILLVVYIFSKFIDNPNRESGFIRLYPVCLCCPVLRLPAGNGRLWHIESDYIKSLRMVWELVFRMKKYFENQYRH
jgi:hypothetical protein